MRPPFRNDQIPGPLDILPLSSKVHVRDSEAPKRQGASWHKTAMVTIPVAFIPGIITSLAYPFEHWAATGILSRSHLRRNDSRAQALDFEVELPQLFP